MNQIAPNFLDCDQGEITSCNSIFPAIYPAAQIRDYRNNYVNISSLIKQSKDAHTNLSLITPGEPSILNLDLPAALRQATADFQATNPTAAPP